MMGYTCEFCTDYIDPTKKEEILQRCTKIIVEVLKENASSGMAVPSDANKKYRNVIVSHKGG